VIGELFISFFDMGGFLGEERALFSLFKLLGDFGDRGMVGSEGIFFRMKFVIPEPILNCLGDSHETPPGKRFLGIWFPRGPSLRYIPDMFNNFGRLSFLSGILFDI